MRSHRGNSVTQAWQRELAEFKITTVSPAFIFYIMKGKLWRKSQIEYLRQFGGSIPMDLLYARFKKFNSEKKLPQRSYKAFRSKMFRLGISEYATNDYLCIQELANITGRSRNAIVQWIGKGLKILHTTPRYKYTSFAEVYEFAKNNPKYFGGISQARLQRVLGDEELARKIIRNYPRRAGNFVEKPVICIETGVVYKSLKEAAERNFISYDALRRSISENRKCIGLTFRKHGQNNSFLCGRDANSARQQDADAQQDD